MVPPRRSLGNFCFSLPFLQLTVFCKQRFVSRIPGEEFQLSDGKPADGVTVSEKIDTYETSIQPFEDCCTIFVAKHPVTKPNIDVIRRSEENLNEKIDELMKQAIETVEVIEVK